MSKEMDVKETPTLVFFSQFIEDQCIKLSGINTYDIYVFLLKRMLQSDPRPAKKPPIEEFLAYYDIIHNKELAIIYDNTFFTVCLSWSFFKVRSVSSNVISYIITNSLFTIKN